MLYFDGLFSNVKMINIEILFIKFSVTNVNNLSINIVGYVFLIRRLGNLFIEIVINNLYYLRLIMIEV